LNELEDAEHIADMKLNNIKGGKQGHSSKWPCLYGKCTKFEIPKRKGYKPSKEELKMDGEWIKGKDYTYEDLELNHKRWKIETGGDENKLKHQRYQNQKHMPLIKPKNKKVKVLERSK